jgi:hypothetical protein
VLARLRHVISQRNDQTVSLRCGHGAASEFIVRHDGRR